MAQVYKVAGIYAAQIAGEDPAMDAAADLVLARARATAAQHRITGEYSANMGTERVPGKRGVTDRIVYTDDPAATHIEWGHVARMPKGIHGPAKWVPGLHIMGRAARL